MAKAILSARKDVMLATCEGTRIHICSAEPASYAGIAAVQLANAAISGSYTKAAGSVSGRKNTLPAQTAISIASSGTATHVAISDNSSILYLVTTCTSQALTSGGTVDTNAFAHELLDPT